MVVFRMRGEIYPYLPFFLSLLHFHPFVGGWDGYCGHTIIGEQE